MSITMSSASLPIFVTGLANLDHCLSKAEASAEARKFDVNVLVGVRLAPDMLPLAAQVRIACDTAKLAVARISGQDAPKFDDNETTMAELRERIARTLTYLRGVATASLDGREEVNVTFPIRRDGTTRTMKGEAYLKHWALPNFFFHLTTAYALLRHNGVDVGKSDYLSGAQASA